MMKRIHLLILIMILNPGCQKSHEKLEKVSIGIQNNTVTALVLTAHGKGFFKNRGLDVTIKKYPSGKLALIGMFKDEVNLSTVSDIPVMSFSFTRNDYQIISSIAYSDRGAWIIARRDHGIKKPSDLKGKRIATQKSSAVHFFLSMFLLHNRIAESKVKIIYMNAVDLPSALIQGKIDAFSMRNPYINQAKTALKDKGIEFFMPGIYRQTFNLVAKKRYIKTSSKTINRVLSALIQAEIHIRENKKDSIKTVAKGLGCCEEETVRSDWNNYVFTIGLEQSVLLTLEDQAKWAIDNHLTDKKKIPDYLNYIYLDGLKSEKPDAITIIY